MIEIKGLNLGRTDAWLPAVESELETRYPIKDKEYYIQNPLIIEEMVSGDDNRQQEELTFIRAVLKGYNVSVTRGGTAYQVYTVMLVTIAIGEKDKEDIFTFYANNNFPDKIHYKKEAPVEIFYMQGILKIREIK